MVGAMHADGTVDERETATLRRLLSEHDLFAALTPEVADMLIQLGTDAISFAGGAERRVRMIAKALPGRTYRLAAYAMACEVCAADEEVADSELSYLEALRVSLAVSEPEHSELLAAARNRHAMSLLERKAERVRELLPLIVDCFVLRRLSVGPLEADVRNRISMVLSSIPDIDLLPDAIESELERAHQASSAWGSIDSELARLAAEMPEYGDRYWTAVYLLVSELARGCTSWREIEFLSRLQRAFELDDSAMDRAEANARLFSAAA